MLFNKNGKGSEELRRLTGSFAASNNYTSIAQEVNFATRELAMLVGQDVIRAAEYLYGSESHDDDPLVDAVRTPIAVLAVARYSALTLVAHEDSGRKIRANENEKLPWEWMIDRDDQAHREKYFRALDALFELLDTTRPDAWIQSEPYRRRQSSIVNNIYVFEATFPIDHSYYVFQQLQSLVIECQPRLKHRIGAEKWQEITADPVADDKLPLLALCQRYAILSALVKAVRRWSLSVFPVEIARRFAPSYQGNRRSQVATIDEMDAFVSHIKAQLEETDAEIAEELSAGSNRPADLLPRNHPRNKFFSAQ